MADNSRIYEAWSLVPFHNELLLYGIMRSAAVRYDYGKPQSPRHEAGTEAIRGELTDPTTRCRDDRHTGIDRQ